MITCEGLTKRYGAYLAVDDVTLRVEPGSVTGFLGPNGAGKSTTMRMIVRADAAHRRQRHGARHVRTATSPTPGLHVGVLLDASAQHAARTGREVLALGALLMGLPDERVDQMLELVGLNPAEAKRRVGNYSLGMRQRLGIAHALLGDPEVLILDEPANGLDPAGIRWMRGLLRGFADRGGTVLLSSHLLHEVEVIADELVVIGRGRIVAQGTKESLLVSAGIFVRGLDDARAGPGARPRPASSTRRCPQGGFVTEVTAEQVGRAAADAPRGAARAAHRPTAPGSRTCSWS